MERLRKMQGARKETTSLDSELAAVHNKVDINDFDYKKVPRQLEDGTWVFPEGTKP